MHPSPSCQIQSNFSQYLHSICVRLKTTAQQNKDQPLTMKTELTVQEQFPIARDIQTGFGDILRTSDK